MRQPLMLMGGCAIAAVVGLTAGWSATAFVQDGFVPDPAIALMLGIAVLIYGTGIFIRASCSPKTPPAEQTGHLAFLGGLAVLATAFLSPLDALGNRSFSLHMVQHLLVIVVAAPLLAFGDQRPVIAATMSDRIRRYAATSRPAKLLMAWWASPAAAWCATAAFAIAVAFWHIPSAHDWATGSLPAHEVENVSMVLAAVIFWRVILQAGRHRISRGVAAFMVALIGLQGALISAVIMFAGQPLCSHYAGNPLEDQTLAGVLMCIPASFAYIGSTVWGLANMIGSGRSHV